MTRLFILAIALLFSLNSAFAGTVKGNLKYAKEAPPPVLHKTDKYKNICGPEIASESFLVGNQGLKNAVVSISGKGLKSKPGKFTLDQAKCRYEPHVIAIPKGSELEIKASDPTNHNIHTYSFDNDPINSMMTPGQSTTQKFDEPEVVKVECDLHKWMSAWVIVTENPHFAISDKGGAFEIQDVPAGSYKLTAWHETLGSITQTVNIADGVTETNFDFTNMSPKASKE